MDFEKAGKAFQHVRGNDLNVSFFRRFAWNRGGLSAISPFCMELQNFARNLESLCGTAGFYAEFPKSAQNANELRRILKFRTERRNIA